MGCDLFLDKILHVDLVLKGWKGKDGKHLEINNLKFKKDIKEYLLLSIYSGKLFLAGEIIEMLAHDEMQEDFCKEVFIHLIEMQTLESMELLLEILKKNPSS